MEFLSQTYLETTTQIVVNSSTITAANLVNPDLTYQYISDSLDTDGTVSSITITFESTQTVDRIALQEMNWKQFNVYYNGVTANAFSLTNPTTTSQFLSNSATNLYLAVTPVAVTSVTFDVYSTIVANSEKAVGYVYLGANELTFERVPNAASYTPLRDPKDVVHELSDGGTRIQRIQTKWATKIKYQYISETFRNALLTVYQSLTPKVFVPFGTGTAWDGILFEANWVGNFDFYKYSDDAIESGYSGSIDLKET